MPYTFALPLAQLAMGFFMIPFNAKKTIAAAGEILRRQPGRRTNYMRLLKLLYIANRRSLEAKGRPICGDRIYAMRRGPVMSATLNLINGSDPQAPEWSQYIKKDKYDLELETDPGNLALSRYEIHLLQSVCEEFDECDEWDLVEWCHKNLPEFRKHDPSKTGNAREVIPPADIFDAVGRADEMDELLADTNASLAFSNLFGDHEPA